MKIPINDNDKKQYCITPKPSEIAILRKCKTAFGDLSTSQTIKRVITMVCRGELVLPDGRTFEEKINSKLKILQPK